MTSAGLATLIQEFIGEVPKGAVIEDGEVLFDLSERSIPFPRSMTSVSFISGRTSGIAFVACLMRKQKPVRCASPSSASAGQNHLA
jgi:hypothetical protein